MSKAIMVDGVGKKFCRSLTRSMSYGLTDIARGLVGRSPRSDMLRPEEFWALEDVSFSVDHGECVGLIGPNGAGKSTLLKMVNGIFMPDKGRISINGTVGALIEVGAGFHPVLTGRENIYINGAILGISKAEIDRKFDEIVAFSELEAFIDTPVKNYSSGMYVRLGFSIAICLVPNVLLLDEILAVGDVRFRHKCIRHVRELSKRGVGMLFVTHSMNDLMRVSHRTIVVDDGRVVFDGNTEQAIAEYQKCLFSRDTAQASATLVRLANVALLDLDQEPTDRCNTGDDVWVSFDVISEERRSGIEVRFVIESSVYGEVATLSSLSSEIELSASEDGERFAMRLLDFPLLRGYYQVHAHLFEEASGSFLGTQNNLFAINVSSENLPAPHRHLLKVNRTWYAWDAARRQFVEAKDRPSLASAQQREFYG